MPRVAFDGPALSDGVICAVMIVLSTVVIIAVSFGVCDPVVTTRA